MSGAVLTLASIFIMTIALVFGFAACGSDGDDGPSFDSALVGTWNQDDEFFTLEFTSDGKLTVAGNIVDCSTSSNTLTVTTEEGEFSFTYAISGDKLTLSGGTGEQTYFNDTYTKQGSTSAETAGGKMTLTGIPDFAYDAYVLVQTQVGETTVQGLAEKPSLSQTGLTYKLVKITGG